MSPFTGDRTILNKVLQSDLLWKELHGNIESIRIFDRKVTSIKNLITIFKLEIQTNEYDSDSSNPKISKSCTGTYEIEAEWDFMILKSVNIKKLISFVIQHLKKLEYSQLIHSTSARKACIDTGNKQFSSLIIKK